MSSTLSSNQPESLQMRLRMHRACVLAAQLREQPLGDEVRSQAKLLAWRRHDAGLLSS